jgi:hypothetical protein
MRITRGLGAGAWVAPIALLAAGCATNFSAQAVRTEIVRQTGADPRSVFELNLGRVTMALARQVLAGESADGALPLAGLTSFELAVYGLPEPVLAGERTLDFTAMPVRGWEPTLRFAKEGRSGVVLVRASGEAIGDLVLVAAGEKDALYARLRGTLSKELPAALGEAVQTGGTDAVRHELQSLTEPQPQP